MSAPTDILPTTEPRSLAFKAGGMKRTAGEAMVWFSSMGLALGLLMVVGLLGVIVVNGFSVFWPQRIVELRLKEDSGARIRGSEYLAGEIRRVQTNTGSTIAEGGPTMERQLFIGNRDAYGLGFRFVKETDIQGETHPEDLLIIERMEYGDAIGRPLRLLAEDGRTILPGDPAFQSEMETTNRTVNRRRRAIDRIERVRIGNINLKMESLGFARKAAGEVNPAEIARIDAEKAALQADYEVLAKQARELRALQQTGKLFYRLPTGEEREMPMGQMVGFYFPNQLGLFKRMSLTLHNIWVFLVESPREANTEGGAFPAIFGTFVMTLLMSIAVTPFGVLAAIYLREYAKQGVFVRSVRIAVNNLAGVPSIVFGVFGLGFFVYFVGGTIDSLFFAQRLPTPTFGTGGILWVALTLALMTVPVVIVATEEAVASVPRGMREGSLACGASKWQTIQRIVLPAAVPGIITGLILAMARGAGEVAPLMLVGVVKLAPTLPLDATFPFFHLDRKFMHLGFHIYDLGFQSPDSEAAKPMVFATTLLLILLVVVLNLAAILLRERLRRKFASGAF